MADKGEFRGFYVALPDSPEFQELSADARAIFYPLKLKLGKAGIDVFYPEVLPSLTGIPLERVREGLRELERTNWLIVQHNVYWIRNGLRFDPSDPLASPNQRMGVEKYLRTLPKLGIVNDFAKYYNLTEPHPEAKPFEKGSGGVQKPLLSTEDGRLKRKTETETTGSASPRRETDPQKLVNLVIAQGLNGERPSDYAKQAKHAEALLARQPLEYWINAASKMPDLFPYSDGEAWDVFDLGKKATKALASTRNGNGKHTPEDDMFWTDPDEVIY